MSARTYWQLCAALPLVMPLVLAPIGFMLGGTTEGAGTSLLALAMLPVGAVIWGGIPYAAFALLGLWWLRGSSASRYARASLYVPIVFAGVFAVWVMFLDAVSGGSLSRGIAGAIFFGAFCLVVGYFYVALAHLLQFLLKRNGVIRDAAAV